MSRATPKMRNIARHLVACEMRRNKSSPTKPSATLLVIEKLRPHLTTLMGNAGFRALLSRAIVLAGAEVEGLLTLCVKTDGSLEGLEELEMKVGPKKVLVLIADLLSLLVAFIGEKLTLQMVHEVWPRLSLDDLNFDEGDKNEKAKRRS
jgi:hypothetical protein